MRSAVAFTGANTKHVVCARGQLMLIHGITYHDKSRMSVDVFKCLLCSRKESSSHGRDRRILIVRIWLGPTRRDRGPPVT